MVSHLDAEVHALVVKVATLEESVRSMKLTMNLQAQQIEALQNRRFNAYLWSNFNLCFTYDRVI